MLKVYLVVCYTSDCWGRQNLTYTVDSIWSTKSLAESRFQELSFCSDNYGLVEEWSVDETD